MADETYEGAPRTRDALITLLAEFALLPAATSRKRCIDILTGALVKLGLELERELGDAKADALRLHREKMDALFGPDGMPRRHAGPVIGYAVRMADGPFVGIWQVREIAEDVCRKQPKSHGDVVIPVCAVADGAIEPGLREFLRISVLGRGDVPMEVRKAAQKFLEHDAAAAEAAG
jgi:hypothetical protein